MRSTKSLLVLPTLLLVLLSNVLVASPETINGDVGVIDEFVDLAHDEYVYVDTDPYGKESPNLRRKTQESERVNIFQKLGESLGMSIVGALLICFMPCLIWKNEGRHVRELSRIDFCKNEAVVVDCNAVTDETNGVLVHFSGEVTVGDALLDFGTGDGSSSLNISKPLPNAVVLKRTCYIYQKFEQAEKTVDRDRIGGGETRTTTYTVKEDWTTSGPQPDCEHVEGGTNSSGIWNELVETAGGDATPPPADEEAPVNPLAAMLGLVDTSKPPHDQMVSSATRVGQFYLSKESILGNASVFLSELNAVPAEYVPDAVPGLDSLAKGADGILRTFPEDQEPQNGDIKIVYEYATDGFAASFVVAQTDSPIDGPPTEAPTSDTKEDEPAETPADDAPAEKMEGPLEEPEVAVAPENMYGVDQCEVETDKCFGYLHDNLGEIWMVRRGNLSLEEMIQLSKDEANLIVKILRIVCWALLVGGWVMLFDPFVTALQVLPLLSSLGYFAVVLVALIVGTTCCCTFTILAYIRYRPLLAFGLLTLVGGIWGVVAWRLNVAAEEGGDEDTNSTRLLLL
mmetsp:Transcript_36002/g.53640  ORF Transcript_36002/g.53640 Transcript_36002/m.53640 type:complete len:569 (-) Transcript_36002:215-1921(-)|eukprot:CAMPEP_0194030108 /NCGR_PEP_ID=MMETSP0009_2-20130614/3697_1 /TAXON_ID=210454 /ORGANISM="Grammatophora oceanica, Strain CCMP 410" /LENGTH=568 /DNA_ID=CAMNT_0038669991 /DNA_START=38 /DNA_END=1744 /DNA_ORIENTATION=-